MHIEIGYLLVLTRALFKWIYAGCRETKIPAIQVIHALFENSSKRSIRDAEFFGIQDELIELIEWSFKSNKPTYKANGKMCQNIFNEYAV